MRHCRNKNCDVELEQGAGTWDGFCDQSCKIGYQHQQEEYLRTGGVNGTQLELQMSTPLQRSNSAARSRAGH